MDLMQEFRSDDKNAVTASIRNPRIFGHRLCIAKPPRAFIALCIWLCLSDASFTHPKVRIRTARHRQEAASIAKALSGKCDIQKIATSPHRVSRIGIEQSKVLEMVSIRAGVFAPLDRGAIRNVNASFKIH